MPKNWASMPCGPGARHSSVPYCEVHGELRPQPGGHIQFIGLAETGGHVDRRARALTAPGPLLKRPPWPGNGLGLPELVQQLKL
jgi:hypothetical protein